MVNYYDKNRFISKSELARLADVSPRTFCRYLASRRHILTAMGISPKAQKLPPQAVKFICEDYCIDLPPDLQDQTALQSSPIRDIIIKTKEKNSWNIGQSRTAVSKDVVILHSERETPFSSAQHKN